MAASLMDMLKSEEKGKFKGIKFKMTTEAIKLFEELKCCFQMVPILIYFNLTRHFMLETNASGEVLGAIFSQLIKKTGQWHLVAFCSRKMGIHKKQYGVGEQKMPTIVEACKHWRHYVENVAHTIPVIIDHINLCTFFLGKILKPQEVRWWEQFSGLDLAIEHQKRKKTQQMVFSINSIIIRTKLMTPMKHTVF